MASTGALPLTLKSITATKINELSKQRALFDERLRRILRAAEEAPETRAKVQVLLEGVCRLKGYPQDASDKHDLDESVISDSSDDSDSGGRDSTDRANHANIRRFLLQSRVDSSVPEATLQGFVEELQQELRYLELKHQQAIFYSDLVTEWLADLSPNSSDGASPTQDFKHVGRAEMHEQREQWESLVFNEADVDEDALRHYLDGLFAQTSIFKQALNVLRERVGKFGADLGTKQKEFSVHTLKWVARSLLRSDLLGREKSAILKEFVRNTEVAQEVADVLNMRLAALDSWSWSAEGTTVEMRRQLNGKYRVFMDEDLLDGLLFHYLGIEWSVAFRRVFVAFMNSRAWKHAHENIPKEWRDRRQYFLSDRDQSSSAASVKCVNDLRRTTYQSQYFMTQLPSSVEEGSRDYNSNDGDDVNGKQKNHLDTKHSLLHLLITESLVHQAVHGQFTAIRSDFRWFGPSLPHGTILGVLKYFGVPENWLSFFKRFLEVPIKFVDDGPNATVQVRKRGVPMSHSLSDCFGEVVLFCMDFAVNQHTDGSYLYRLHDDFWFWGRAETCISAWKAMKHFAQTMGLEFNAEKTGSVQLGSGGRTYGPSHSRASDEGSSSEDDSESDESCSDAGKSKDLPTGEIRWGFLKLDADEGKFVIDQNQVDSHITELKRQLESCKSIFGWVQAWNSYFGRFFSNNFGKPAICFGREHIDMAISTLSRIERTLFSSSIPSKAASPDSMMNLDSVGGSHTGVTAYLRQRITERFDVCDLPEGFFYFPVELGGLELLNPFISLLAMRENIKQTPQKRLRKAALADEIEYHSLKERFVKTGPSHKILLAAIKNQGQPLEQDEASAAFLPLAEFMQYPESHSQGLLQAYRDLIMVPEPASVNLTPEFQSRQQGLINLLRKRSSPISHSWDSMTPYWRWTAELYQAQMTEKYGGLAAVEREFMLLGVVKSLKEGKFRWQS